MKLVRRCIVTVAAMVAAAVPLVVAAPSAVAAPCPDWHNGASMPGSTCGRNTFIFDPGIGHTLSRANILQHQAYYGGRGFNPNFLWYAPETDRVFQPDSAERWSGRCSVNDTTCVTGTEVFHRVVDSFSDDNFGVPIVLPSLSFGNGFIAVACGNYSEGTAAKPVPVISGHKFHDQDRDGVRDPDEPGLAGWTMTLHRDRSDAGQGLGAVATAVTNADGFYEFALDGHYPGDYSVTEENRTDWARTTSPDRHRIAVTPGVANHRFGGNDFGNVETKADAVKVSFDIIEPPAEMRADAATTLRVRAVLENRGPAPIIDVEDVLTASGPADCTFQPASEAVHRRLVLGQPAEIIFTVAVTCTEPSFHPIEFSNALTVTTAGVTDPDQASNHRKTGATIAVIDESDVAIENTVLDCATRTYINDQFTCTTTATVTNGGDHGPANADVILGLTGPSDCVLTPAGVTRHEDQPITQGTSTVVTTSWDVVCGQRSYHNFSTTARVELDHLHVVDPTNSNNSATATDQVEVFERVDLAVTGLRLTCSERQYQTQNITCISTVGIANSGPATAVQTRTTVDFTAPSDCTVNPTGSQLDTRVLNAGGTATFTRSWTVTCTQARRHTFSTSAAIAADEPHPEDTNLANNTASIAWQPIDVKPRSFPSSINLKKEGLVPVAILSTTEFNALTQVDRSSLTFGATGTENSLQRCADNGEDVNDDGLPDLICHFENQKTGLTCDSTTATLVGRTADGRRFEGQDDVKITGC
jgi:hypothetical protein